MGRQQGLTDEKLEALGNFETSAALDERERLVLRYAVAMTETPVHVPDGLFAAIAGSLNGAYVPAYNSAGRAV